MVSFMIFVKIMTIIVYQIQKRRVVNMVIYIKEVENTSTAVLLAII